MRAEMQDRRIARAAQKRTARREEILQIAQEVISRKGYKATSVADVIEAAGISRGTFYLYFDGIDALFHELVDGFIKSLTDRIQVVRREDGPPVEQLFLNVRRVVDLLFDKQHLTVILLREAIGIDEEVDRKLNDFYSFLYRMVAGALRNGAAWGLTRQVNEPIVAMAVIGSIKEVLYQHLVVHRNASVDREQIAQELLEFGLMGLQRPSLI